MPNVFGDRQQAALAGEPVEGVALVVAATVASHGTGNGFSIDAGAKILGKDVAPYLDGYGAVLGVEGAIVGRVYDHHGVIDLPDGAARPTVGDVVSVVPNHVCPVVNLVDEYLVARGGRLVDRWLVDARGRNA
jgi:D-serine deaminase-like pyridoxal phosphate-dependent protein